MLALDRGRRLGLTVGASRGGGVVISRRVADWDERFEIGGWNLDALINDVSFNELAGNRRN